MTSTATTTFRLNGTDVGTAGDGTLLEALREEFGCRSAKDGCSPQGQCGCCTVWIDGAPRVACVTPVRRVAGREVTTAEGLDPDLADRWAAAFVAHGASQCGFCTPGIVMRLAALATRGRALDEAALRTALAAHLCRCTGWQTIVEAAGEVLGVPVGTAGPAPPSGGRDPLLASWRAELEGGALQESGPAVVLGGGGFADDRAPDGALVAVAGAGDDDYALGSSLAEARERAAAVPGRRTTLALTHPVAVAEGSWALVLRTAFCEPAYLEPDASWCRPGGRPASPLANGGAFGAKLSSPVPGVARRLADETGRPVRVLWDRPAVVRRGPVRPPLALALRADGTGIVRVGRTPSSGSLDGIGERVAAVAPGVVVEEVAVAGPPVSAALRGAVWAEVAAAGAALGARRAGWAPGDPVDVTLPGGGRAVVALDPGDGRLAVAVWAGEVLDPATLRSYCLGAVHQALGWVRTEGVAVDAAGEVHDRTIRSFGILGARDTPPVDVTLHPSDRWPVNGSDAVLVATMAAAWLAEGLAPDWPTRRGSAPGVSR